MEGRRSFYGKTKGDPFVDTFYDPLCKLNLKETSEFVKSLPMANNVSCSVSTQRRTEGLNSVTQRRVMESPSTPGRPVFGFSVGNLLRNNVPSKWDEAEKWLVCSPCNDSPSHTLKPSEPTRMLKQCEVFAEKSRVTEERISKAPPRIVNGVSDLHLKGNNFPVLLETFQLCSEPLNYCYFFNVSCSFCIKLGSSAKL